jgi:hypothetical protein
MVDLIRHTFGQPGEFALELDVAALVVTAVVAFALTGMLFDPEQRFVGKPLAPGRRPSANS